MLARIQVWCPWNRVLPSSLQTCNIHSWRAPKPLGFCLSPAFLQPSPAGLSLQSVNWLVIFIWLSTLKFWNLMCVCWGVGCFAFSPYMALWCAPNWTQSHQPTQWGSSGLYLQLTQYLRRYVSLWLVTLRWMSEYLPFCPTCMNKQVASAVLQPAFWSEAASCQCCQD